MEWLRCNKCYNLMERTSRNFFLTQCGHVFCDPCISEKPTKCHECGKEDFGSLPLTRPPKLEAMLNYFSSTEDFMALTTKGIQFHDEQLGICLRAFQIQECKYEKMKKKYRTLKMDIAELSNNDKRLEESAKQLKIQLKACEEVAEHSGSPANMNMDVSETPQNSQGFNNRQANQSQLYQHRNLTIGLGDIPARSTISEEAQRRKTDDASRANWKSSLIPIPEYSYNSSPAFSNKCHQTAGSRSTDSGCSTSYTGTPASGQTKFLVPSIQRVPKSVASIRRKARTLPRLSVPKNENYV